MKLSNYIKTIDIAHPPIKAEVAEDILSNEIKNIRNGSDIRVIKIIHGYGSTSNKSILKDTIKNWCFRNKDRFLAIIDGEEYNIFDTNTQKMRKSCGQVDDTDLGAGNKGITLIWVK